MSHLDLRERIKTATVFARVVPEQKLLIVNALKANGEIVAMTGDGVNDAPALKAAHIGISMGERGTDVAREASDLVLLNDDFASIIHAIQMGRRIYENLKKAMAYILAVHVPIAGMSFFPILMNMPLILLPAHIAFLEIVIDPACSVVFESEPEESDAMKQPPRSLHTPILSQRIVVLSLIQGVFSFLMAGMRMGMGVNESRALVFATLVFSNIMLILTNLSWKDSIIRTLRKRNESLPWVIAAAILLLALVLIVPFLRNVFYFSPLHLEDIFITMGVSIISILWFEGYKFINKNYVQKNS
jgi:Ca2+-transporting ATPase